MNQCTKHSTIYHPEDFSAWKLVIRMKKWQIKCWFWAIAAIRQSMHPTLFFLSEATSKTNTEQREEQKMLKSCLQLFFCSEKIQYSPSAWSHSISQTPFPWKLWPTIVFAYFKYGKCPCLLRGRKTEQLPDEWIKINCVDKCKSIMPNLMETT